MGTWAAKAVRRARSCVTFMALSPAQDFCDGLGARGGHGRFRRAAKKESNRAGERANLCAGLAVAYGIGGNESPAMRAGLWGVFCRHVAFPFLFGVLVFGGTSRQSAVDVSRTSVPVTTGPVGPVSTMGNTTSGHSVAVMGK
jgi:hypothetical protein